MEWGAFVVGDWTSPRIWVADTFCQRWRGLRPSAEGVGMLIDGRSVHGFGMTEPLLVVGLDGHHRVVGFRTLGPRRIICFVGAVQILELPAGHHPPPEGAVLSWVRGGKADPLRNPHRKPRRRISSAGRSAR